MASSNKLLRELARNQNSIRRGLHRTRRRETIRGRDGKPLTGPNSSLNVLGQFRMYDEVGNEVLYSKNDVVYYELRKFIELVSKNNPNIIELLNTPEDCVLYKHPIYDRILEFNWITKQCKNTFAGYAYAQIKKAKGLNKKVLNPMDKERKSVLDFCFVTYQFLNFI